MTDRQKVKHAVEVLVEIEARLRDDRFAGGACTCGQLNSIESLRKLISKPHAADSKVAKVVSDKAHHLSGKLLHLICKRKMNFRTPDLKKWASDMDKIIRLDKRSPEHIADVIDWCQHDEFWQDNILSPAKLRLQLDKLELRMSKDNKWLRDHRLRKPAEGKSAKDRYVENLNAENSGVDE